MNFGNPYRVKAPVNIRFIDVNEEYEEEGFIEDIPAAACEIITPEAILKKAAEEAETILENAKKEALLIIEDAAERAERIYTGLTQEAWEKGFEVGREAANAQYSDLIKEAEFIREHAKTEYNEILRGMEAEIIELVIDITKKVAGNIVRTDRNLIVSIVKELISDNYKEDKITLKVSPLDYEHLILNLEEFKKNANADNIELRSDASQLPGGVVIKTRFGSIEAGVETKINLIEEAFLKIIGKGEQLL